MATKQPKQSIVKNKKAKAPIKVRKNAPKTLGVGKKDGRPTKYTIEWAVSEATWMLYFLKEDALGKSVLFESEMCEIHEYAKERWSEVIKKYSAPVTKTDDMTDKEYEYAESMRQQFVDLIDRIRTILHNRLLKGGLVKKFDGGMTKFVLVNHHNYKSAVNENYTLSLEDVLKKQEDEIK